MDNKLHKALSKSALYARRVVIPATLLILILSFYLVDGPRWSNDLTIFEALLGVVGIWLTLEIFKIGMDLSDQQTAASAKQAEQQTQLLKDVQTMLITSMKIDHIQELARRYEEAKIRGDEAVLNYWHFAFRFETWTTNISIQLEPEEDEKYGAAVINVLGVNKSLLDATNLEKFDLPIYTVDVTKVDNNKTLKVGRGYCTCLEGNLLISNDANESFLEKPTLKFSIIGHTGQVRNVKPKPPNYCRLVDLNEFSEVRRDRTQSI